MQIRGYALSMRIFLNIAMQVSLYLLLLSVLLVAGALIGNCQLLRARDGCHYFIRFQKMTLENLLWSILQLQELEKINVKMKSRLVVCFCATD